MSHSELKAPFPWFGGKSRVAHLVWERFGEVRNYVEPFAGSLAVLLGNPSPPGIETVNDKDCLLANFWRALKHDPDGVASWADNPVNEADQHARHFWLVHQEQFRERMKTDPGFYDVKIAGWWVWGQCIWIGSGWCARQLPHLGDAGTGVHRQLPHLGDAGTGVHRKLPHLGDAGKGVHRQLPHLGDAGKGVHRQLPHLGNAGTGVHRKRPHLGNAGKGVHRQRPHLGNVQHRSFIAGDLTSGTPERAFLFDYLAALSNRLRRVRVCCGDWKRVLGPSPTTKLGLTGIFLDPPYADAAKRTSNLYAIDDLSVAHEVREWALAHGDDPKMRIALCGYEGEHAMPRGWECVEWKARGGYGSQGSGKGRGNARRERIWFSPYCLAEARLAAA
jgi:D12 class N6 adenine-specific DNA methyltransferase